VKNSLHELIGGIATMAMFVATLAVASTVTTPSYATMSPPKVHSCHWSKGKKYCSGSRYGTNESTELFPSRCNGELGFWEDPVVFQNGETLCIARSTADFYGGSNLVPTCTVKYYSHKQGQWISTTSDGACPSKQVWTFPK